MTFYKEVFLFSFILLRVTMVSWIYWLSVYIQYEGALCLTTCYCVQSQSNEWSNCSRTCGMGISHRQIPNQ